jgi:hypothetical protein
MNPYIHPTLRAFFALVEILEETGRESSRTLRQAYRARRRTRIGSTVRPGPETPLWNELAKVASAHVTRYGDKAKLGRYLGVPRQRVHEYLVAQTAYPDTERALRLLAWLLARNSPHAPVWSKSRPP